MSQTLQTPSRLHKIFEPTPRGVIGLAEDVLALCLGGGIELTWQDECCRLRCLADKSMNAVEIPLPKSVFRALLARIAALCNEHRAGSVTPYGGRGELVAVREPVTVVEAKFSNTPAEQKLTLTPVGNANGASPDAKFDV